MNKNLQKAFNKLQRPGADVKLSKEHKVSLGLLDELEYDYTTLQDEVGRLAYSTEEWFDENFERFQTIRTILRDVYINYSESFLDPADVEEDKKRLQEIKQKADELGIDYSDIYADLDEHMQLIEDLDYFNDRFINQQAELKGYGL